MHHHSKKNLQVVVAALSALKIVVSSIEPTLLLKVEYSLQCNHLGLSFCSDYALG